MWVNCQWYVTLDQCFDGDKLERNKRKHACFHKVFKKKNSKQNCKMDKTEKIIQLLRYMPYTNVCSL